MPDANCQSSWGKGLRLEVRNAAISSRIMPLRLKSVSTSWVRESGPASEQRIYGQIHQDELPLTNWNGPSETPLSGS